MLFIVGTPIGNLGDMSPRALEVLRSVDRIACEDTRRTGLLLASFGIQAKMLSYHEHNRASREDKLLAALAEGKDIALVSDAGMPCISDPGKELVQACAEKGIPVTVIPGPVAAVAALVLSGLETDKFFFEGFLPSDGKERKVRLDAVSGMPYTVILYESPHRLLRTLEDLSEAGLGMRRIAVCREMTKKYEETVRKTVDESLKYFLQRQPKGEFVLILEGQHEEAKSVSAEVRENRVRELHRGGCSTKEIASILSVEFGESKNSLYADILEVLK
jgi:16S rRNA (cytidine1402-2'-O)-methyltransferase